MTAPTTEESHERMRLVAGDHRGPAVRTRWHDHLIVEGTARERVSTGGPRSPNPGAGSTPATSTDWSHSTNRMRCWRCRMAGLRLELARSVRPTSYSWPTDPHSSQVPATDPSQRRPCSHLIPPTQRGDHCLRWIAAYGTAAGCGFSTSRVLTAQSHGLPTTLSGRVKLVAAEANAVELASCVAICPVRRTDRGCDRLPRRLVG